MRRFQPSKGCLLLAILVALPARAAPPAPAASPAAAPSAPLPSGAPAATAPPLPNYKTIEAGIPQNPSPPPVIRPPVSQGNQAFRCDRQFIFEGHPYSCDSFVRKDAENLRPIFKETPAALEELNEYQRTRRNIRTLAYVSSAGILLAVAGLVIKQPAFAEGEIRTGGLIALGGVGLSVGTFVYSLSLTRTNELHLGRAVDFFNQAHPDNPIVLQFSTHIGY